MEIYVAGKTDDWERVRRIQEMCTRLGHGITYDWTQTVEEVGPSAAVEGKLSEEFRAECAYQDRDGVANADLLIAVVDHPGLCGTLIEIGMAIIKGIEVITVGEPERNSVFFSMAQITKVKDEFALPELLPAVV